MKIDRFKRTMSSNDEDNAMRNLLPLKPKEVDYPSDRIGKFKALTDPSNDKSVKYDFVINHLEGTEDLRELIRFYQQAMKLGVQLGFGDDTTETNGASFDNVVNSILHSTAKNSYEAGRDTARQEVYEAALQAALDVLPENSTNNARNAARNNVDQPRLTVAMVEAGLKKIIEDAAPYRVLSQVKRFLRRLCRKPADMKIKEFVNHFTRINQEELPRLPPFQENQSLAMDEVLEIMQYAIPNSWNKEMRRQGFDPLQNSLKKFIDFCERQEESEGFHDTNTKNSSSKKKKDSRGHRSDSKDNSNGKKKYCKVHGENDTHTTNECKTLDGMISNNGNKSSNKTWKRNDYGSKNSTNDSKKEMAALMRKFVRKEVHSLYKGGKKRKQEAHAVDKDDDSYLKEFDDIDMDNIDLSQFDDDSVAGSENSHE